MHRTHGTRRHLYAPSVAETDAQLSTHKFLTAPNLFTLVRLCCIPLFLWMLFGRDNRAGAAFLLGDRGLSR